MTEMERYWNLWSRYWFYIEDFFLDIDVINRIAGTIEGPVLIVGAGQGLLVEELRKAGFQTDGVDLEPNMIAYARERRGIDLVEASANDMPFADGEYQTTIIATGVVDFMEDEEAIEAIIREARRVTDEAGKILAAFHRYHHRVEELLRYSNLITDDGVQRFRRLLELARLSCVNPGRYFRALRSDADSGYWRAVVALLKVILSLPRKEIRLRKRMARLWKQAEHELDCPDLLINCAPEFIPYRDEKSIRSLFRRLDLEVRSVTLFDSCVVAQL